MLHLGQGDTWSSQWFDGSPSALVTVTRKLKGPDGEGKEAAVYVLSAGQKSSREVFSRVVAPTETISVDARLSPSLTHAICKVRVGKAVSTMVLPVNGGSMVPAPEIDQAETKGLSGPSWSSNGTALNGEGFGPGTATLKLSSATDTAVQTGGLSGTFEIRLPREGRVSTELAGC